MITKNLPPELIKVPKKWFMQPLRQAMRLRVRPVTGNTRKKQLSVKMQVPKRVFEDLMEPLLGKGVQGLEQGFMGTIRPTSWSPRVLRYDYVLNKGSLSDALFHLEDFDPAPKKRHSSKDCVKRGLGCARLHLSAAAGQRGELALTMAMICGAVIISYREPTALRAMGTLTLKMFVLSMDHTGHIIWPCQFTPKAMASLRRQARSLLERMMQDPGYPIHPKMKTALDPNINLASILARPLAPSTPPKASLREIIED